MRVCQAKAPTLTYLDGAALDVEEVKITYQD